MNAFDTLSTRRTIGFSGENPISMSDIAAYLAIFPTRDESLFVYLIGEMDMEYLSVRYGSPESSDDG